MVLNELNIVNYKNIAEADIVCSPRFNCFIGNNGAGKTNVLDAVYQLSMCKSYFNLPDAQNIRHGENFFIVEGRCSNEEEVIELYCGVKSGQKKIFKKNKKAYTRLSDHIGLLPLVIVSPADVVLVDGASEERRRFMDGVISQCDKEYLQLLIRYNRVLVQRNKFLKEYVGRNIDVDMLSVWDDQLVACGRVILERRRIFVDELEKMFQQYYYQVSQGKEKVMLTYSTTIKENDFTASLRNSFERDRLLTYTTVGIHRDDLNLSLEGYPVKKLGSQGQKKSFLVALKLAQFAYLKKSKGVKPVLLLDDIFDKLDAHRVSQIIQMVASSDFGQVFITDTNREHIDKILQQHVSEYKIFCVENGEIKNL